MNNDPTNEPGKDDFDHIDDAFDYFDFDLNAVMYTDPVPSKSPEQLEKETQIEKQVNEHLQHFQLLSTIFHSAYAENTQHIFAEDYRKPEYLRTLISALHNDYYKNISETAECLGEYKASYFNALNSFVDLYFRCSDGFSSILYYRYSDADTSSGYEIRSDLDSMSEDLLHSLVLLRQPDQKCNQVLADFFEQIRSIVSQQLPSLSSDNQAHEQAQMFIDLINHLESTFLREPSYYVEYEKFVPSTSVSTEVKQIKELAKTLVHKTSSFLRNLTAFNDEDSKQTTKSEWIFKSTIAQNIALQLNTYFAHFMEGHKTWLPQTNRSSNPLAGINKLIDSYREEREMLSKIHAKASATTAKAPISADEIFHRIVSAIHELQGMVPYNTDSSRELKESKRILAKKLTCWFGSKEATRHVRFLLNCYFSEPDYLSKYPYVMGSYLLETPKMRLLTTENIPSTWLEVGRSRCGMHGPEFVYRKFNWGTGMSLHYEPCGD